ncbi:MAG: substrate-binding protein [Geminicoccaceae bacterium]|nr:substrate-binding protein [Geminicoccaceae bacterium]MCS7268365.1 substrate-binding protein [Geminicoccaceae bacterium]MCX7629428.1 substrate-binding protein [Geminicoccaceae bacterium]MDW8124258.1 substrate-binding protein [Geminicoccaceae bacterium]MDW8341133.1 substrate-binding protein [Geminicoccaceae bacterium]
MPIVRRSVLAQLAAAPVLLAAGRLRAQARAVKVGAVLPFSGGLELFGEQARLGLELAAAEINAKGGILGRPVEILFEDDKTDPKTAVEKASRLVTRDEVVAIFGPITSSNRDAMAPTMARARTPLLYATNYEGGACGRYLFVFNTVPNQELAKLLPYLFKNKGQSFYFFGADYVWPQKMFQHAEKIVAALGGKVLGRELTPFGVKEFAPVIRRIEASGAKVLLFALPGADGITFIRQAEDLGLLKKLTVGFLGFSEAYLGAFGPGKGQDMYVAVPFVASSEATGPREFVARIRARAGRDAVVSHYVMTHWLALTAMARALEKVGRIDREAVVEGLEGLTVEAPTGPVTIGAKDHHVTLAMFLARTQGDQLVTVEALGPIAPESGCA